MNNRRKVNPQSKIVYGLFQLLIIIILLVSWFPAPVLAQTSEIEPQIVTAYQDSTCGDEVWHITIDVWNVGSDGGEKYAQAIMTGSNCVNGKLDTPKQIYGTFTGGPNGNLVFEMCDARNNCFTRNMFFADGKTIKHLVTGADLFIVENPEAFDAWNSTPITQEYIFETYGIRVEDSLGDDKWEKKSWSDHELSLLNDVLKVLPPGFLKNISLTRIVRNTVRIDTNGDPRPSTMGLYTACDRKTDLNCDGSSSTIRIFDTATTSTPTFPTDQDREFKATILHEITHAYQYFKDTNKIFENPYESPQVRDYLEATRPDKSADRSVHHNGWGWYDPPKKWKLYGEIFNEAPTRYAELEPIEDMSESVKMYVYAPEQLLSASEDRYKYIRDYIFGGTEYDNGKIKKP